MAFILNNSLFFHIPKTAGRATRHHLKEIHKDGNELKMVKESGDRGDGDAPLYIINNKPNLWKSKNIKFTTIRHPATWHISKYLHMLGGKNKWNKYYNNPKSDFYYDDNYSFRKMGFFRTKQEKTFSNYIDYIINNEITLLTDEFNKLSEGDFKWDYIMKVETLNDDINQVMELANEPIIKSKQIAMRGENSKGKKRGCVFTSRQYEKLIKLEEEIMKIGDYKETPPKTIRIIN